MIFFDNSWPPRCGSRNCSDRSVFGLQKQSTKDKDGKGIFVIGLALASGLDSSMSRLDEVL